MQLAARTGSWSGKKLPYKRVLDYLEGHGTEYLVIDETIDPTDSYEVKFFTDSHYTQLYVFGSRWNGADHKKTNYIILWNEWGGIRFYYNPNDSFGGHKSYQIGKSAWNAVVSVKFSNNQILLNGEVLTTLTNNDTTNSIDGFELFDAIGHYSNPFVGRIYDFKLNDQNGVAKMHLIPVMSLNDEPCMYDELSGRLFKNAGTGEFAYGELSSVGGGYKWLRRFSRFYWRSRASRRISKRLGVAR